MKKLSVISISLLLLCACQEVEKVLENPKLQQDSKTVAEDLIDIGEEIVEDETGVKVNVALPQGKANAASQGKK